MYLVKILVLVFCVSKLEHMSRLEIHFIFLQRLTKKNSLRLFHFVNSVYFFYILMSFAVIRNIKSHLNLNRLSTFLPKAHSFYGSHLSHSLDKIISVSRVELLLPKHATTVPSLAQVIVDHFHHVD